MVFENIQQNLFYIFATIAVISALGVILHRNPIAAAILLVLTFFSLAAIYAILGAVFLATMQVLVYAGAIMVLVVFVLMLLSLRQENISKLWHNPVKKLALFLTVGLLALLISMAVSIGYPNLKTQAKGVDPSGNYIYEYVDGQKAVGNIASIGAMTFTDYLLAFELIAILLLVSTIGAVILTKRTEEKK